MGHGIRAPRVEHRHQVRASAEGAEGHAAADILAEGDEVRPQAQLRPQPARCEAAGHHLVEDEQRARLRGQVAQRVQEGGLRRDAAATPQHRFQDDGGEVRGVLPHESRSGLRIVVGAQHDLVRDVHRAATAAIGHQPAMVAALHREDPAAPGRDGGGGDGQQVRLGAGVGEANPLDRGEAVADEPRQPRLEPVVAREVHAHVERAQHGGPDRRVGVSEQPRRVLADHVHIGVAVRVVDAAALPAGNGKRVGAVEQDAARVAARHDLRGALVEGEALRPAARIDLPRFLKRRCDAGIAKRRGGHAHAGQLSTAARGGAMSARIIGGASTWKRFSPPGGSPT
jgi:hypothetical protein